MELHTCTGDGLTRLLWIAGLFDGGWVGKRLGVFEAFNVPSSGGGGGVLFATDIAFQQYPSWAGLS
jgi:hypothetical protein